MSMFDEIGSKTVDQAQAYVKEDLQKLQPLAQEIENRFGGILHGLLDRFEIDIHIKLNSIPKAHEP